MLLLNHQLVPEGLPQGAPGCLTTADDLLNYINKVGFLPLFKNSILGFSAEEHTQNDAWWSGNPKTDPWEWRGFLAESGQIAYGKFFAKKAGFVAKQWFPLLASYRRDGYDFDSRYEDGLANRKAKKLYDILEKDGPTASPALKKQGGFGKNGETGFETTMTTLQMQTYIVLRRFERKRNKHGDEYGWGVGQYSLAEDLWNADFVKSAYNTPAPAAKQQLLAQVKLHFPGYTDEEYLKEIK
ncbi:hypothetical protein LJC61_04770 [Ruminococcaceae bacterium OttesenSCG-928-A16]|nr:hypothetical protein [Ruminococcaceae bacterium OttesenSCG-928-A16]